MTRKQDDSGWTEPKATALLVLADGTVLEGTGFGTAESMRRTFVRHLGTAPDQYRTRFTTHRSSR